MFPNSWLLVQETRLEKTFSVKKGTKHVISEDPLFQERR